MYPNKIATPQPSNTNGLHIVLVVSLTSTSLVLEDVKDTHKPIINHEYVRNVKYWTICIPGNYITKMPVIFIFWDQYKIEYFVKPFYQQRLSHIRFIVEHYYNAIRFTVSNKNTAARFFAHHCVYKINVADGIIELVDNLCT